MMSTEAHPCDTAVDRLKALTDGEVRTLSRTAELAAGTHVWSQDEADAVLLALAAQRPLLVRGEPGTGKTQLARAVADLLGWALHGVVIHPRFEPQSLLCEFDALRRLADAQAARAGVDLKPDEAYWKPGPFWLAHDWRGAQAMLRRGVHAHEAAPAEADPPVGHVVLIDEIDKADSDLPNSLLEVLGQRGFRVPGLAGQWIGGPDAPAPLVIITTNEERELPAAFLRRCVVLELAAPDGVAYADWLIARGRAHHGADTPRPLAESVLARLAERLADDRQRLSDAGLYAPGLAEYLDLLAALHRLAPGDEDRQADLADRLCQYALQKNRGVDARAAHASAAGAAANAPQ